MAYGVDTHPSPQARPKGHFEVDIVDGEAQEVFIEDFDEDGRRIEDEEQEEAL